MFWIFVQKNAFIFVTSEQLKTRFQMEQRQSGTKHQFIPFILPAVYVKGLSLLSLPGSRKRIHCTYFVQCPLLEHVTVFETNSTNHSHLISVPFVFHIIQVLGFNSDSTNHVLLHEDCLYIYDIKIKFILLIYLIFILFVNFSVQQRLKQVADYPAKDRTNKGKWRKE